MKAMTTIDWTKEETAYLKMEWKDYNARLPIRRVVYSSFPGNRWKDQPSLPGQGMCPVNLFHHLERKAD